MSPRPDPVLIVEDDTDMAEVLQQALESLGLRSNVALNGREALAEIAREPPRAILLDVMMPVMDGWQFRAEQLRRPEACAIPVIVMTADGRAREKAIQLRAIGWLRKPVSIEALKLELGRADVDCG
jgi:CheY-like chemotaxis protein